MYFRVCSFRSVSTSNYMEVTFISPLVFHSCAPLRPPEVLSDPLRLLISEYFDLLSPLRGQSECNLTPSGCYIT